MERSWTTAIRQKADLKANLIKNAVVGILISIVFYNEGEVEGDDDICPPTDDTLSSTPLYNCYGQFSSSAANIASLIFFMMMYCVMNNLQAIPQLCNMTVIYRREHAANAYSPWPYYFSLAITNLPIIIFFHLLMMNLSFWSLGFDSDQFGFFFGLLLMTNITAFYFAQFLAAATGTASLALAIFPVCFLFFSMFAGFSILLPNVSSGWEWATYISYPRWAYQGLMVSQFEDVNGGDQLLKDYGFDDYEKANSFPILLIFTVLFGLLTYLCLRPRASKLEKCSTKRELVTVTVEESKGDEEEGGAATKPLLGEYDPGFDTEGVWPTRSTLDVEFFRKTTGDINEVMSRGMRLIFLDVDYKVPTKHILKGISGRVHPGEMCALMGASGAGKSTLLDVIAARKSKGEISGQILFNGEERSIGIMRQTAYVMQDTVHIPVLTVRETLQFAARL
jgi:hypothetical protein